MSNLLEYLIPKSRDIFQVGSYENKIGKLYFNNVYKDEETYLNDQRFANDHPCTVGMSQAIVQNITQKMILQKTWNNLNSPGNPRNYFHGKVTPTGTIAGFSYISSTVNQRSHPPHLLPLLFI